jgi:hypothetical protein
MGRVLAEMDIKKKLNMSASIVGIVGKILVKPSEYLNPIGQAISSAPAAINVIHAIKFSFQSVTAGTIPKRYDQQ